MIAIGQGKPEPFVSEHHSLSNLSAGEKETIKISDIPLSLEGHGIVAVGTDTFTPTDRKNETFRAPFDKIGRKDYEPLATFSVWDKEHYETAHKQPQRTQQFTLFTSVMVVFFAIIQGGQIIGRPIWGVIGGCLLFILYWLSGFLEDFYEALKEQRDQTTFLDELYRQLKREFR